MRKNKEKITKELCFENNLIFLPETREEARLIQEKLLGMGYKWIDDDTKVACIDQCCQYGLILDECQMSYRTPNSNKDYLLCTLSQFDRADKPLLTQEEQVSLRQEFKELAARQEEIFRKIDAIYEEIMPKVLDKPMIGRPKRQSGT